MSPSEIPFSSHSGSPKLKPSLWLGKKITYNFRKPTVPLIIENTGYAYALFLNLWDKELISQEEQVWIMFLDHDNDCLGVKQINTGDRHTVTLDLKTILSCALACNSSSIILAHNHPGGDICPSETDKKTHYWAIEEFAYWGINIKDGLIISPKEYFSFAFHTINSNHQY